MYFDKRCIEDKMYSNIFEICYILLLLLINLRGSSTQDPCTNYKAFPYYVGAFKEDCIRLKPTQCHRFLEQAWYFLGDNVEILNRYPIGDCGSDFPAWLNGSYPSETEGIVIRSICVKSGPERCKYDLNIHLKNCSSYMVYKLKQLKECPSTYCLDTNLPCTTTTITTTTTTLSTTSPTNNPSKSSSSTHRILPGYFSTNSNGILPGKDKDVGGSGLTGTEKILLITTLVVIAAAIAVFVIVMFCWKTNPCHLKKAMKKNRVLNDQERPPPSYEDTDYVLPGKQ